jgi:hypothetical protein
VVFFFGKILGMKMAENQEEAIGFGNEHLADFDSTDIVRLDLCLAAAEKNYERLAILLIRYKECFPKSSLFSLLINHLGDSQIIAQYEDVTKSLAPDYLMNDYKLLVKAGKMDENILSFGIPFSDD